MESGLGILSPLPLERCLNSQRLNRGPQGLFGGTGELGFAALMTLLKQIEGWIDFRWASIKS